MKPKQPKQECLCALVNGQCEKCAPKPTETWRERFNKEFMNEFGTPYWCCGGDFCCKEDHIDEANDIKSFIQSEIDKAKEEGETLAIQRVRNFNFGELGKQMEKYINEAKKEQLEEIESSIPDEITGMPLQGDEQAFGYKSGFNSCLDQVHAIIKQIKN